MKNTVYILFAFLLSACVFVSCSGSGNVESEGTFNYLSAWPVYVVGLLTAMGSVPHDGSSNRPGMRALSSIISKLVQLAGSVLCIAGFWRWDIHWGYTLLILVGYGIIANCTSRASSSGYSAILQLICALASIAACIFAYIQLW